jgi:hypothetical protein
VFDALRDAFSRGWLPDGSFATVKPESYDGSLLASSSSFEGEEEEPKTPTPRREVEAVGARVWLGMYDSADGRRGPVAAVAQPHAQLRLRPRGGVAPRVRLPRRPARPGGDLTRVLPLAPHRGLTELTMPPMYHSPHALAEEQAQSRRRERKEEKKERRGYGW